VSKTIGYRLFGLGRLPAAARAHLVSEEPRLLVEGVRAVVRADGRVPGKRKRGSIRWMSGSFLVTAQRVVASCYSLIIADVPIAGATSGPGAIALRADGLTLTIDVGAAHPQGEGRLEVHIKTPLSADELARLPQGELRFTPAPELVQRLF
jgi:hypothetical protein